MTNDTMGFRVMTLNLRFGLADDGEHSWRNRITAYPGLFSSVKPDFIGMQEANDFQIEDLERILPDYRYMGKFAHPPKFWQNNIIFYKKDWQCVEERHYFLSDTPSVNSKFPESKWPRQCVIGLFRNRSGRELIHVNTHFDFKAEVQEKCAELIIGFLSEFPKKTPIILTGDFNTSPDSQTYAIFRKNGFMDLFENRHSSTYHGFTGKDYGGHIDWILHKGSLKGIKGHIIHESFNDIFPSDHFPVFIEFEFTL